MRTARACLILGLMIIGLAGCHDGYSTFSYGYDSGPSCGPSYTHVEYHDHWRPARHHHHHHHHGHHHHGHY